MNALKLISSYNNQTKPNNNTNRYGGFTIIELLIVIVIIGILVVITSVAYTGLTKQAKETNLTTDLKNAHNQLLTIQATAGTNPNKPPAYITPSKGLNLSYTKQGQGTCITANYPNNPSITTKHITQDGTILEGACPNQLQASSCPTGYIPVPGNPIFNTHDFCVMKYEAKNGGSNTPVSTASGAPWVSISQTNAITYSKNLGSNYQLITEEQWLTIAHNVLNQPENWSGGQVGSGYIYRGHSDSSPDNALVASSNDNDGYSGTGNSGTSNQKRTLKLSNGQTIWDLAGNVSEWTQGIITGVQPGPADESIFAWREYDSFLSSSTAYPNLMPDYGTPQAVGWSSNNGIGQIHSNPTGGVSTYSFYRGGAWSGGLTVGIFRLHMGYISSSYSTNIGFRTTYEL